jgi:OmpA-OmpF porin, OOP family
MALSPRRAEAVRNALVEAGVPGDSIVTAGRGETEPVILTADSELPRPRRRRGAGRAGVGTEQEAGP